MALTDNKSYIFFHVYKCGGMSLRKELYEAGDVQEILQSHSSALDVREYYREQGETAFFDKAFKFAFVRNPFDWIVSLYEFMKNTPAHEFYEEVKFMEFEEFVVWNTNCTVARRKTNNGHFMTQTDFLYDEHGTLLVDSVYKVESFDAGFRDMCTKIGMPHIEVPKINTSERKGDYHLYYNQTSKRIAETFYQQDLINFGYKF